MAGKPRNGRTGDQSRDRTWHVVGIKASPTQKAVQRKAERTGRSYTAATLGSSGRIAIIDPDTGKAYSVAVYGSALTPFMNRTREDSKAARKKVKKTPDEQWLDLATQAVNNLNESAERILTSMDRSHHLLQDCIRELRDAKGGTEEAIIP